MSSEKSVIIIPPPPKNLCPVCGKAAYSLGGIHPQCAIQQADEPRMFGFALRERSNQRSRSRCRKSGRSGVPSAALNHTPAAKSASADIGLADAKVQL